MAEFIEQKNYSEENKSKDAYELTDNEKELVSWVTEKTDDWRDYRDQNFLDDWLEYERIFYFGQDDQVRAT